MPEESWLKIREDFIKQNGLRAGSSTDSAENNSAENEALDLLQGPEEISEDPLIVEAEKLFGKEFVEADTVGEGYCSGDEDKLFN